MNSMFAIDRARSPGHGDAIAGRDIRIRRIEINFPATSGRQNDPVRTNRFYLSADLIEDVNAERAIFHGEAEFASGDQVDRHMIFQ